MSLCWLSDFIMNYQRSVLLKECTSMNHGYHPLNNPIICYLSIANLYCHNHFGPCNMPSASSPCIIIVPPSLSPSNVNDELVILNDSRSIIDAPGKDISRSPQSFLCLSTSCFYSGNSFLDHQK